MFPQELIGKGKVVYAGGKAPLAASSFQRLKKCAFLAMLIFAGGFALVAPGQAAEGTARGITLCAKTVIPSLFPFLVVCGLVINSFAAHTLGLVLRPYTKLLGIRETTAATALLMGLLGGFAVGGKAMGDLCDQGLLSPRQCGLLLCVAAGPSPAFVTAAVGGALLQNPTAGWLLWVSLTGASFVCGALAFSPLVGQKMRPGNASFLSISRKSHAKDIFSGEKPAAAEKSAFMGREASHSTLAFSALLAKAVSGAVSSTLTICGFVLLFSFVGTAAEALISNPYVRFLALTMLEMTGGCAAGAALPDRLYLCAAGLSVLGASAFFQLRALLPAQISLRPLLLSRLVHLPLTIAFLRGLTLLFPAANTVAAVAGRLVAARRMAPDALLLAFLFCLVFTVELAPEALFTRRQK